MPIRLHEKIKETREPVVGLDFVKEWIAVSDPEMEPHYECGLCGNKGIANGMFSHIMGYKHRQAFVEEMHKDDPSQVLQLTQRELLDIARRMAENGDDLSKKIKTRRSDEVDYILTLIHISYYLTGVSLANRKSPLVCRARWYWYTS